RPRAEQRGPHEAQSRTGRGVLGAPGSRGSTITWSRDATSRWSARGRGSSVACRPTGIAGYRRVMAHKSLDVYLNDHLSGAIVGSNLAEQIAERAEGTPLADVMTPLAAEIAEDRATLEALMD